MRQLSIYFFTVLCLLTTNAQSTEVVYNHAQKTKTLCERVLTKLENKIKQKLNAIETDADFTLLVKSDDGKLFEHSIGNSNANTVYRSASTSKWVTASIILSVVNDGLLSLDDHPQDYIDNWPTVGELANIKLRHLLNFTSGLVNNPNCSNSPVADYEACVNEIINQNINNQLTPGTEFNYGSSHLQVAGLMAVKAQSVDTWQDIVSDFKNTTGLFPNSEYDLPSSSNPRLAGGMHWTANDYLGFLQAFYNHNILTPELIQQMSSDQIASATIVKSPAFSTIGEDWHYGFGNWIECHVIDFNCAEVTRVSSPGAYGAYPFIDYAHGYYGILAREGTLGTFSEGYAVFSSVSDKLEQWAGFDCDG